MFIDCVVMVPIFRGRKITPQGRKDLDLIAAQVSKVFIAGPKILEVCHRVDVSNHRGMTYF